MPSGLQLRAELENEQTESRKSGCGGGKVDGVEDSKVDVGAGIAPACLTPFNPISLFTLT